MPVKTFKSRFKTVDDAVDFLLETQARTAEFQAKTAESQAKTDLAIQRLSESQDRTDLAIQRLSESQDRTDLAIQRLTKQVEETSKEVRDFVNNSKNDFSRINQRLGHLVEFIVAPGIRQDMEEFGYKFRYATANKVFRGIKNGKNSDLAEVDLLLSNGTKVMAVEVKTTLTVGWVKEHIDRLNTLREFEKYTKIQGKELLGAVAGVFINSEAREYAKKKGLYVIEILEDKKKLKIDKPSKYHVW